MAPDESNESEKYSVFGPGETVEEPGQHHRESSVPDVPEPKYQQEEWLYQQYVVLGKTLQEIANECDVREKTIWRWVQNHEIDTRSSGPRPGPWKNEDWLREQYTGQQKSVYQIADEQDCDEKTIRNWLAEHEIEPRDYSERHPASREERPYHDEDWLRKQYEGQGKSSDAIADAVGVSAKTIRYWLDQHEIETRTAAESRRRTEARPARVPREQPNEDEDNDEAGTESDPVERTFGSRSYEGPETGLDVSYTSDLGESDTERLTSPYRDEGWLREQYAERGSIEAIAELCNVTSRTIRYWMDKYGIDRQHGNEDADYRDEEWLRAQYEELSSTTAIARECSTDVTPGAIRYWMDEFGIERDDPAVAGAQARWDGVERLTYETFLDALVAVFEDRGEWPTVQQYANDHPSWGPAKSTVYQMDAFPGWDDAIEDAKRRGSYVDGDPE